MKRNILLAAGLAAALAGAPSVPALAHGTGSQWGGGQTYGPGAMMGNDQDEAAPGGYGMMGGRGGMMRMMRMMGGGMGGPGMMGAVMQQFDANGDGTVTPDELSAGLTKALKTYDTNGDGTLSLDEFAKFYATVTRSATVRHFQFLDADGDGKVTAAEITAPAKWLGRMQSYRQSMPGATGNAPAGQGQMGPGQMGQGQMMNGGN